MSASTSDDARASGSVRAAVGVTLVVALLLAPGAFFCLPGKSVAGAWRVLQGEVPYRDFWSMYAPGEFLAVAGLLAAAGRQVVVPALVACVVRACACGVLTLTLRRVGVTKRASIAVGLVLGASLFELSPELSSYPPAFLLVACALAEIARICAIAPQSSLARAGVLLGCAALFKHDVAGYAAAGCMLGLALARALSPAASLPSTKRIVVELGLSATAVVAVLAAALALLAGRAAWTDLIEFPWTDFAAVRGEPYPGLAPNLALIREFAADTSQLAKARDVAEMLAEWLLGNAPQLAFLGCTAFVVRARRDLEPAQLALACIWLALMPFYWWAAHTQQNTHFTTLAWLSWSLGALAWGHVSSRAARVALTALAGLYAAGLSIRPASELYLPLRVWSQPVLLELPGTRGLWVSPREREVYRAIHEYVTTHTEPDEPIHLGVARHDAIVINNPRYLWLLDRPCATRYHELHPGITDREDVQREMLADLERKRVRCAVIWNFGWSNEVLERILARRKAVIAQCGAPLLDQYFAEHFRVVLESGEYAVLWRDLER
ncbi:MAG: hypothetical protein IT454_04650 [Planctomycetes bacterium]|nr:hypothetical protein [Planctomycetota bacterium]